jgi:hypothetical protein
MLKFEKEICSGWNHLPKRYPVMWWFFFGKGGEKLRISLEVGPIADTSVRQRLLTRIKEAGFSFRESALREETRFTRVLSEVKRLRTREDGEVDEDPGYIQEVTEDLWKKAWLEGAKIVDVLRKFDWPAGS